MSKITRDNRYVVLPWNHDEIVEMLKELDTKRLLSPEEYNILINEKGVENLVTELDTADLIQRLEEIDNTKARKEDFELLISKLNQLIRVSENQEEGNLELLDIRNGANGKTYLTAGDAIRNQFKDLNSLIEPVMIANENQEEQIYKLKVSSAELLENYNTKISEVDSIIEKNRYTINQLNEINEMQDIRISNIERRNAEQQIYLNALLDSSDMAKQGKVEYTIQYDNEIIFDNLNPRAGGVLIIDNIKGLTLTNLSTAYSRFIIEKDMRHVQDLQVKPNTNYIVKFKCETENKEMDMVKFDLVKAADHQYKDVILHANNNIENTITFQSDPFDNQLILDCEEEVEIVDLTIIELIQGLNKTEYFNGVFSTFEEFLNEDTGKYEVTLATIEDGAVLNQIDIYLTDPLMEYDELVYYGGIGFCHIHRTEIDEETKVPIRIEDESTVEKEILEFTNSSDNLNQNELFLSTACKLCIYKKGSFIIPEDEPNVSAVPPESVKIYYDSTMYNAAAIASTINEVEDQNYEVMAINWDMNYRMSEIQWALEEAGLNQIEGDVSMEPTIFSIVEVAKKLIQAHKYVENIFIKQLDRYLLKGVISKKEHKELMDMINKQ